MSRQRDSVFPCLARLLAIAARGDLLLRPARR